MAFIRLWLALFLLLPFSSPAQAFETGAEGAEERAMLRRTGEAFLPIAKDFGCPVLTWADFTDPQFRTAQMEYVPEGHDVQNWTRLQTTTVYALTGRADADTTIMNGLAQVLVGNYQKTAEVIDLQYFENGIGEPAFFIEYKIGEGDAREHNAGVFMRTSDKAAAFMQIQARKGELPRRDTHILLGYLGMAPEGAAARRAAAERKGLSVTLPRKKPRLPPAAAAPAATGDEEDALSEILSVPGLPPLPPLPALP